MDCLVVTRITENNKCTGCGLCANLCPEQCISLQINQDGFQVPIINTNNCIGCGKCQKGCPVNKNSLIENTIIDCYAAQLYDKNDLMKSASGGAFSGIARNFIKQGGYVVGCVDDIEHGSSFRIIDNLNEINLLVGSKYYQCNLNVNIYKQIKEKISLNKRVLFIGTPCQVEAIKTSVGNNENLYLIDILCQGVPSKKVVDYYHKYMSRKFGSEIVEHIYRCKDNIDRNQYVTKIVFNNDFIYYGKGEKDLYNRSFQRKIFLRESCYNCKYTNLNRKSDLTLGDFWGLKNFEKNINDGVSLVLINTDKGKLLCENSKESLFFNKRKLEEALPYNKPLTQNAKKTVCRGISYKFLHAFGFSFTTRVLCCRYYLKSLIRRN